MKTLLSLAISVVLAAGVTPSAIAEPANAAAKEFVLRQHLGGNLKTLGLATAQKTQTFAILVGKMGMVDARELVSRELDAHARQFEGQWNENLAKAYARSFTSEELRSLASEGRHSRYFGKVNQKQAIVGEDMQRMSTPILTAYVTAALSSAFAKMPSR